MKKVLVIILFLGSVFSARAQSPAQNCMGAIPICQTVYTQMNTYAGAGSITELNGSNQGCLTTGESNSAWYILNTSTSGSFVFTITPFGSNDYDFAVWDLTDKSCDAIAAGLSPIRCNYASLANSVGGGLTGLSVSASNPSVGAGGGSFSSAINAIAGQTYVIVINSSSSMNAGYTIDLGGSTCQIIDNIPPYIKGDSVAASCSGPTSVRILLSENVLCNSYDPNGSDFHLNSSSSTITAVNCVSCNTGGSCSNLFDISFSAPLNPGSYAISVVNGVDGNTLIDNCGNAMIVGSSINFTVYPSLQLSATTQFGCAGSPSGVITLAGSGGVPPYLYRLNSAAYTSSNMFSGLLAGTYTITIKDSVGCTRDTSITLVQGAMISINSASVSNLTCYGINTGSVTVNAIGGVPPLSYSVGTLPYAASNVISNLAPGNHMVHVKDSYGCVKDTVIFISSPGQITVNSVSTVNATCSSNNGMISLTAYGGISSLGFALNSGPYLATGNFTNLASGSYIIHIKDLNNCIKDTSIVVGQVSQVAFSSMNLNQAGCTGNAGVIAVSGAGGTLPYTYSLNGGAFTTSSSFVSLSAGSYTVVIKDATNCTVSTTAVLTSPSTIYFSNSSVVEPTCTAQGSITVGATGGLPPYLFAIGSGAFVSSNTFTPLVAGTYLLHVKDANGCIHDSVIVLQSSQGPSINSLNTVSPTCSFPTIGSIHVNASGGLPPLAYSVNGSPFGMTSLFTGLAGGIYTITTADANGCTQSSLTTLTSVNTLMFISFIATNVGCNGTPLASITASAGNGNAPYQYSLNGSAFSPSGNYSSLNAGNYTIVAKDASACTKSTVVIISSSATLSITNASSQPSSCFTPATGSISISGIASAPPVSYSLNGGPQNATGLFPNLAPGLYTVHIRDANNCDHDSVMNVAGPPSMFFTNSVVGFVPCYGGVGSISLSGGGGVPSYSYSLNAGPFTSISNWPSLVAGTYTITLKDANNCLHDTIIDLFQPTKVAFSNILSMNASCAGLAIGSISINVTNGTPPYTYALNSGSYGAASTFAGLNAGVYVIHVKDVNGCPKDTVVNINNSGNFTINSITKTTPSCHGLNNGGIAFGVTGGNSPYQYALNGSVFGSLSTFNGLSSGAYTLHAKDNAGCTKDSVLFLTQPSVLGFSSIQITPVNCHGGTNATVIALGSGGSPYYQGRVDGGAYNMSGVFTNLTAGSHTVGMLDSKGCTRDSIITIGQPAPLFFNNVTIINPGCQGAIGVIHVNGSGGVMPYVYAIGSGPYSSSGSFANLPVGNYLVHIKDHNGCIHDTVIALIYEPLISINSINYTPIVCGNGTNGSINVLVNSFHPPVNYSYNGGVVQTAGVFTGLAPGNYIVHAQDQAGCYLDSLVTIQTAPPIIISNVMIDTVLCHSSSDGVIVMSAIGGLGPLQYALNTGNYVSTNNFQNLNSGIYTMHVRDSISCQVDSNINLATPPIVSFSSITMTHPHCSISTDGQISINASGGQGPYLYAINSSLYTTNNQFQNLFQGTYTVHIKDYHNCIQDTVIYLDANNYMDFTNVLVHNVRCKYGNDGAISLDAIGGFGPYHYTLNGVATGTFSEFPNLGNGQYTINVTDVLGCQEDTVILVNEPLLPLKAQIINVNPNVCRGDSIGVISASGLGGTSPYTYSLDSYALQTSPIFNGLLAGNYQVTIKDVNGCIADTIAVVTEPDTSAQLFLLDLKNVSCFDVNDGAIKVTSKYCYQPVHYFLNGLASSTDTFYHNLSPGNYIIEVKDGLGCKSSGKFTVEPSDRRPYILVDSVQGIMCAGDLKASIDWHTVNTFAPYYYTFDSLYIDTASYVGSITNGNYTIHVVDSIGCHTDTIVSIVESDQIDLLIKATPALCNGQGDDGKATAIVVGGQSPFAYSWSGSIGNSLDHAESLWYGDQIAYVTDQYGCTDSAHFEVDYDPCCQVTLPNAFSPNGDGNNDLFRLIQYGYVTLATFEIYNRWGSQVFSSTADGTGWDGKYLGQDCELGTYYYLVRYHCHLKNETILIKGDVTLIR